MAWTGVRLAVLMVIPQLALAWGESRHSIDEVLIEHILVDSTHVYCGCNTSWGSNTFGLFVFDRRAETWVNYGPGNGLPSNRIEGIRKAGDRIAVEMPGERAYFDRETGHPVSQERRPFESTVMADTLRCGGLTYVAHAESVIVEDGKQRTVHVPSAPPTRTARQSSERLDESTPISFSFHHLVPHAGKVFFAYDRCYEYGCGTQGVGVFDPSTGSFAFHPSDSLRGCVTACLVDGDALILATGRYPHEGNARPAVGFVRFSPGAETFESWAGIPLPRVPLAILSVDRDDQEYWIGTDRGIVRADKRSGAYRRYGIRRGVAGRDGINVHAAPGRLDGGSPYPVAGEIAAGDTVMILGVFDAWCEVVAPFRITGFVTQAQCTPVVAPTGSPHSRLSRVSMVWDGRTEIVIRERAQVDANAVAVFQPSLPPPVESYEVVGRAGRPPDEWCHIVFPTAWISSDRLVFVMEEVEQGF